MSSLIAKSPCVGLVPLEVGALRLTEHDPGAITCVMAYDGQEAAASDLLKSVHGMAIPAPRRTTGRDAARAVWFGQGQVFVLGPQVDPTLGRHAALADQSDAWAVLRLDGPGAADVLARLTPLDLNPGVFKRGHTARSSLGHMNASITRIGADSFEIMVFRSMAQTAVHELDVAMRGVTARAALG